MSNKMEKCLVRMLQIEKSTISKPVLVCCDACVTDEKLKVVSPSLWERSGAYPEFLTNFNESAATPFVTGCTMLLNKAAKESVLWNVTEKQQCTTLLSHCVYLKLVVLSNLYVSRSCIIGSMVRIHLEHTQRRIAD